VLVAPLVTNQGLQLLVQDVVPVLYGLLLGDSMSS
jgi:hypothetical protein